MEILLKRESFQHLYLTHPGLPNMEIPRSLHVDTKDPRSKQYLSDILVDKDREACFYTLLWVRIVYFPLYYIICL